MSATAVPAPIVHVCCPSTSTRTLCGEPGARVAAINYAEFGHATGPLCRRCQHAATVLYAVDLVRWACEDSGHA